MTAGTHSIPVDNIAAEMAATQCAALTPSLVVCCTRCCKIESHVACADRNPPAPREGRPTQHSYSSREKSCRALLEIDAGRPEEGTIACDEFSFAATK